MIVTIFDNEQGFKFMIGLTCTLWVLSTLYIFKYHDFKLSEPKKIETFKEDIYSLNNSNEMSGSFILGSGTINLSGTYSYFIKNQDGSKQRKSIQSDETRIYEDSDKPYFEEITCKNGSSYSFKTGFFEDIDICANRIERKLYVPKNTIISDFSIK